MLKDGADLQVYVSAWRAKGVVVDDVCETQNFAARLRDADVAVLEADPAVENVTPDGLGLGRSGPLAA